MKIKVVDDKVVLEDGKPVFIKDDGTEQAYNVGSLVNKISELNRESAGYRVKAKDANEKLVAFEGIDPAIAAEALKTVKNLGDKKLIDAGEVETIKAELSKGFKKKIADLETTNSQLIAANNSSVLKSKFAESEFVKEKTNLSSDIAFMVFGEKFTVDGGVIKTKDNIMSQANPGDPAGFEEALSTYVDARADKSSILKTNGGGSGGQSGSGGTGGNNPFKDGDVTAQATLIKSDRVAASAMAKAAGKSIPGLTD